MSGTGGDVAGWISTLKKGDLPARHEAEEALRTQGEGAVEPLIQALREDEDTDFRWYAARVLARIGSPAIGHLIRALKGEKDQQVRRYLAASLGEMGEAAVRPLLGLLSDPEPEIRGFAALALCRVGRPAIQPLSDALDDPDETVRSCAALILWQMGEDGMDALGKAFTTGRWGSEERPTTTKQEPIRYPPPHGRIWTSPRPWRTTSPPLTAPSGARWSSPARPGRRGWIPGSRWRCR